MRSPQISLRGGLSVLRAFARLPRLGGPIVGLSRSILDSRSSHLPSVRQSPDTVTVSDRRSHLSF